MIKKTLVFAITNAAGLGHLTRGLAIARKLKVLGIESIFFTTSQATELIRQAGFRYFYVPTKSLLPANITMNLWGELVRRQLEEAIKIYKPAGIAYEGVLPPNSVIMEMQQHKEIKSIWIKRENYKAGWQGLNALEGQFDLIIVPKEAGEDYEGIIENNKKRYCNPITFLDEREAYSRNAARQKMGVRGRKKLYYVQMEAGNNIAFQNVLIYIQQHLLKRKKIQVIIGQSLLEQPMKSIDESIKVMRNYPSSRYFHGIDFAIAAAGYNTFHELVEFKVPTLFIPNEWTAVDDQVKRVRNLEQKGAVLRLDKLQNLDSKIELLEEYQKQIIKSLKIYQVSNGAWDAARMIANILDE